MASELIDEIMRAYPAMIEDGTVFYDFCCGSGAVTIELINRGMRPDRIVMLDVSSWGAFWRAIGSGTFSFEKFDAILDEIPQDKSKVKDFMSNLASQPVGEFEAEIYPILQSCSFGGKQIWRRGDTWGNAFFRDYWLPKPESVRKSPANPMQPAPGTLQSRIRKLAAACRGITALHSDIESVFEMEMPRRAVAYVDPPYRMSTGYAYGFDLDEFIERFCDFACVPLFVSEGKRLSESSKQLNFTGAKGGISGLKARKHEEWLTLFK